MEIGSSDPLPDVIGRSSRHLCQQDVVDEQEIGGFNILPLAVMPLAVEYGECSLDILTCLAAIGIDELFVVVDAAFPVPLQQADVPHAQML